MNDSIGREIRVRGGHAGIPFGRLPQSFPEMVLIPVQLMTDSDESAGSPQKKRGCYRCSRLLESAEYASTDWLLRPDGRLFQRCANIAGISL